MITKAIAAEMLINFNIVFVVGAIIVVKTRDVIRLRRYNAIMAERGER